MDRAGTGCVRRGDDGLAVEIAVDSNRLVGLGHERGVLVGVDENRDGAESHFASATEHPGRDLAAVGHQDRLEAAHRRNTP